MRANVSNIFSSSGRLWGPMSVIYSPHQAGHEGQCQSCPSTPHQPGHEGQQELYPIPQTKNRRFNYFLWEITLKRVWFLWKNKIKKDGLFNWLVAEGSVSYEVITAISITCFSRTRPAANTYICNTKMFSASTFCMHTTQRIELIVKSCKRALNGKPAFDPTWNSNCNNILPHNFSIENSHVNKVLSCRWRW